MAEGSEASSLVVVPARVTATLEVWVVRRENGNLREKTERGGRYLVSDRQGSTRMFRRTYSPGDRGSLYLSNIRGLTPGDARASIRKVAGVIQSIPCSAKTTVSVGWRSNTPPSTIALRNTKAC